MAEPPNKFLTQASEAWNKLSLQSRVIFVAIVVAVAGSLAYVSLGDHKNYALLFRLSEPKEVGNVTAALEAAKIPNRLSGGGTIVEVPREDVDRARILLAQQDLPRGGTVDFHLYDEPSPGWTRETERVNYLRALQGELQRTITALDQVSAARIHLSIPKKASFADEEVSPTASVTIRVAHGRQLRVENVRAIQHLVAAAVERLDPGEVVVLDSSGRLLSRNGEDELTGQAISFKREFETAQEAKVTRLLERVIGAGGVQVSIETDFDFSRTETQEEFYDPEQLATRSETTEESYEGKSVARPEGLAGAVANQPGAAAAGNNKGAAANARVVKSRKYEVNRTVVKTIGPRSELKQMTVSVLVDGSYTPSEDGGEPVFTPRSAEELEELKALVENAVGYNASRGDRIAVSSKRFNRVPAFLEGMAPEVMEEKPWALYGTIGGALLLAGIVFMVMRSRKKSAADAELVNYPTTVADAQRALAAREANIELPPADEHEADSAMTMAALRSQILESAESNPERAAEIVKAWIHDKDAA